MKVYFVRHGESEGNRNQLHHGSDSPLTEIGVDQAAFVVTKNIGITMCTHDNEGWRMEAWNDHAHLG